MPFLHVSKRSKTWFKWAEEQTQKTGLRGTILTPLGNRYRGEWSTNLKCGKGAELLTSGSQYEGDWQLDKPHGWGVRSEFLPEDNRFKLIYIGEHRDGKYHGFGHRHYDDGAYHEGEFKEGKRNGYGRCWYPNGCFYEGLWDDDLHHGNGMFVQANGNRYEGTWENGMKEGSGVFYHLDTGQTQTGVWKSGVCVTSFMEDMSYRQAALHPTRYPIPQHQLRHDTQCVALLKRTQTTLTSTEGST